MTSSSIRLSSVELGIFSGGRPSRRSTSAPVDCIHSSSALRTHHHYHPEEFWLCNNILIISTCVICQCKSGITLHAKAISAPTCRYMHNTTLGHRLQQGGHLHSNGTMVLLQSGWDMRCPWPPPTQRAAQGSRPMDKTISQPPTNHCSHTARCYWNGTPLHST